MNKDLAKEIRDARGQFIHVHLNVGTNILGTEANLPRFGTVWFDNRCIGQAVIGNVQIPVTENL